MPQPRLGTRRLLTSAALLALLFALLVVALPAADSGARAQSTGDDDLTTELAERLLGSTFPSPIVAPANPANGPVQLLPGALPADLPLTLPLPPDSTLIGSDVRASTQPTFQSAALGSMAQAERVHTDATGWRVAGTPAQLMVFTTETTTVYQIRQRHRNEEVREVIPAGYAEVLCTDRGPSYDTHPLAHVKQQKCGCHLQRSVSELLETKWGRGRSFGLGLRRSFAEAIALRHAQRDGTATAFAAFASVTRTLSQRGHSSLDGLLGILQGMPLPP